MLREIKFRGLRSDGGGWVYGYYAVFSGRHIIYVGWTAYEVKPESVGQFTGLYDKNGTEIYDADKFEPDTDNDEVISVVRWDERVAKFVVDSYGYDFHIGEGSQEVYDNELSICDTTDLGDMILEYCEIIGNIHQK